MERLSRRKLLTGGGSAALLGAIVGTGVAQAQADKPIASPWAFVVDVAVNPDAIASVARGAAGPFYLTGNIYRSGTLGGDGTVPSGAVPIGTYRCWGWTWDPSRIFAASGATQSFDIGGRGEIVANGILDERSPLTGGTGEWRGANGQADIVRLGASGGRVWFDITNPVGANGPN